MSISSFCAKSCITLSLGRHLFPTHVQGDSYQPVTNRDRSRYKDRVSTIPMLIIRNRRPQNNLTFEPSHGIGWYSYTHINISSQSREHRRFGTRCCTTVEHHVLLVPYPIHLSS
jgi:hypothetical protein